jgi:O-antigen/teichoic acid export membrane protein
LPDRETALSPTTAAPRRSNPLPTGTFAVGVGLVVAGLTTYLFLIVANASLPSKGAAPLTAIWGVVFFAGPGFFLPLEQEVSRAIAIRRAQGLGSGPLIERAAMLGGMLAGFVLLVTLAMSPLIVKHLFDGQWLLLVALLVAVVAFFLGHLVRGVISGSGLFWSYSLFIGSEGVIRLVICLCLAAAGAKTAGGYGVALALAPLSAFFIVARGQRAVLEPGPAAPWSELSQSLGALLAGSVLAQGLANASLIVVKPLARADQQADVKRLFNGVIVARLPLFLFQAVQAALLPKLAALSGARRYHDFRRQLSRLVEAVVGIGILGTLGGFVVGPFVVKVLFDAELGHVDMALLAGGTACYIVAMSLAQALIAIEGQARMALGWLFGALAFLAVLVVDHDLLLRVELSALVGSAVAAGSMTALLLGRLRTVEAIEDRERLAPSPAR